jgi:peptidoglycan/LPS O-acetylase OafA/YrhL
MSSRQYRPDIDGLRAIAVSAVLLFHAFPTVVPGGFVGVDIFFVISGYLISGLILGDLRDGSFSVANFFSRRIVRIFPALITVLSATLALGWFFFLPNEFISLGRNVYAGALFFPNLMLLSEVGYFDTTAQLKPLLHLWSLGIEEQFYFAFPLFLIFCWRRPRILLVAVAALAIASFALNIVLLKTYPSATFYLPITRAWELMDRRRPCSAKVESGRPAAFRNRPSHSIRAWRSAHLHCGLLFQCQDAVPWMAGALSGARNSAAHNF